LLSFSSPRLTPTNHLLGIKMKSWKSRVCHDTLQLCVWIAATHLRSYDFYDCRIMHLNFVLAARQIFAALLSKKCFWHLHNVCAYIMYAHLGKQHISSVNPIIGYTSFFITAGLTNARKWIPKISFFCIMAWEPIFSQPWMLARHAASQIDSEESTMIAVISNSRAAVGVNESKHLWNVLMCFLVLHAESLSKV
jgi:hypothetical protein